MRQMRWMMNDNVRLRSRSSSYRHLRSSSWSYRRLPNISPSGLWRPGTLTGGRDLKPSGCWTIAIAGADDDLLPIVSDRAQKPKNHPILYDCSSNFGEMLLVEFVEQRSSLVGMSSFGVELLNRKSCEVKIIRRNLVSMKKEAHLKLIQFGFELHLMLGFGGKTYRVEKPITDSRPF